MASTKFGIIQEQGDYNIFNQLNDKDQETVKNDRKALNESRQIKINDQIRLGDCAHLNNKR